MVKGTTSTGFEFEYDERRLDDVRYVDVLAIACDDEVSDLDRIKAISALTGMLLGKELKQALYEHIGASHEGRVPPAELNQQLSEIMAAARRGAEKN